MWCLTRTNSQVVIQNVLSSNLWWAASISKLNLLRVPFIQVSSGSRDDYFCLLTRVNTYSSFQVRGRERTIVTLTLAQLTHQRHAGDTNCYFLFSSIELVWFHYLKAINFVQYHHDAACCTANPKEPMGSTILSESHGNINVDFSTLTFFHKRPCSVPTSIEYPGTKTPWESNTARLQWWQK